MIKPKGNLFVFFFFSSIFNVFNVLNVNVVFVGLRGFKFKSVEKNILENIVVPSLGTTRGRNDQKLSSESLRNYL